jgi:hypothetical protein
MPVPCPGNEMVKRASRISHHPSLFSTHGGWSLRSCGVRPPTTGRKQYWSKVPHLIRRFQLHKARPPTARITSTSCRIPCVGQRSGQFVCSRTEYHTTSIADCQQQQGKPSQNPDFPAIHDQATTLLNGGLQPNLWHSVRLATFIVARFLATHGKGRSTSAIQP